MRLLLPTLAAVAAVMASGMTESRAQSPYDYPICAVYQNKSGAQACYYASYEQCMATMSGIGGYCIPNPFYRGGATSGFAAGAPPVATPHRRIRRHHS